MPRPILATIHSAALRHNLERVRQAVPDAKLWAVVKANAYGHGIENVFEALRGADGFAMLDLAEAERVRQLGWRGPILLLERSEEHTSELQSRLHLVCRLLLEKKNKDIVGWKKVLEILSLVPHPHRLPDVADPPFGLAPAARLLSSVYCYTTELADCRPTRLEP